jgi:hypothetical protein
LRSTISHHTSDTTHTEAIQHYCTLWAGNKFSYGAPAADPHCDKGPHYWKWPMWWCCVQHQWAWNLWPFHQAIKKLPCFNMHKWEVTNDRGTFCTPNSRLCTQMVKY